MSLKRKIALAVILIFFSGAGLVILLTAAYFYLPVYLESRIIPRIASEAGLSDYAVTVRHVGFFSADLGTLRIGPPENPALLVRSVQVDYTPRGLYHQKIKQVTLGGIEIYGEVTDGRFKLRGVELDKILAGAGRQAPTGSPPQGSGSAVSLAKLAVRDSRAVIRLKEQIYRLPFELDIAPQDAQYNELEIAAQLYPRGETVGLAISVNRSRQRAQLRIDSTSLDLSRFADLTTRLTDTTASGLLEINIAAELRWGGPLRVSSADASFVLRHAKISGRGIHLQTSSDDAGALIPLRLRLSADKADEWRISGAGISMMAPAHLNLAEFEGMVQKNAAGLLASIDFRAELPSSEQTADLLWPLNIRDPVPLWGRFSGAYHQAGKWRCDISNITPEGSTAGVVRLNAATYAITSSPPEFNLSAQSESGKIAADYMLSVPSVRISAGAESIDIPKLILTGTAQLDHGLAGISYDLQAHNSSIKLNDDRLKISKFAVSGKLNRRDVRQITSDNLLQFSGASARLSRLSARIDGARGKIPFKWPAAEKTANGSLYVASLKLMGIEIGSLSSRIRQTATGLEFEGRHQSASLPWLKSIFSGSTQFFGKTPLETRVRVELSRPAVAPEIDLGKLVPDARGIRIKGKFQLAGDLMLNPTGLDGMMVADFDNGNLRLGQNNLSLEGIRLTLSLPELPKIRSAPGQQLHFERISLGDFVAQKGRIDFQIESMRSLLIEKMNFKWCDGNVETQSMRLSSTTKDYQLTFYCDRLNLVKVLEQFGAAAAAEGRGSVNGRIPLQYSNGKLKFDDGFLFSTPGEGGKIRLTGTDILTAGIPPNTPQYVQMDLAREALKDYDYTWARLNITSRGEELLLQMQMDGKPARTLPFVYRKDMGGFIKVEANAKGSKFQGIRLDVNFRLPLDKILQYKELIEMIK